MELAPRIEFLSGPGACPYPVETVEVRHAHISVVFLAGPFVYEVKEPAFGGGAHAPLLKETRGA
jgi:aminoglycoside phosphotransferase family enzyme